MAAPPHVTVVIPTYNRAALLEEAIESVLRQSYRDFEILVCDDGSTDDTRDRTGQFGDPVRYLALQHSGYPGSPRNRGVEAARGDLIAFLDDDDLWEPEKLARQVELMDNSTGLNFVYTDRRTLAGDYVHTPAPSRPDRLLGLILNRQMPFVGSLLVTRELLQRVGGFDETLLTGEDLDLLLRLAPLSQAASVAEPLVMVRRQVGSVSERAGKLAFENAIHVLERWLPRDTIAGDAKRQCHAMLAHLNARLAVARGGGGDMAGAFASAVQAIRYAPDRAASWAAWPRAFMASLRRR